MLIQNNNHHLLPINIQEQMQMVISGSRIIRNYTKSLSDKQLVPKLTAAINSLATSTVKNLLQNALVSYRNMESFGPTTGLTNNEIMRLCIFLETEYKVLQGSYFKKELHDLPRTIEKIAEENLTLIHLKTHNIPKIGKGYHKVVTYSIDYHPEASQIVATQATHPNDVKEAELLRKFAGLQGIIQMQGYALHPKGSSQRPRLHIICELYKSGSVRKYTKKTFNLSIKQQVDIARQLFCGLKYLNKRGYCHRDLHSGNIYLDIEEMAQKAVIGDFGRVVKIADLSKGKPQMVHSYFSPENIFKEKQAPYKYMENSVFALGISLFRLYYRKKPSWTSMITKKEIKESPKELQMQVIKTMKNEIIPRFKELKEREKSQDLKIEEQYELQILKSIHPNPKKRGTSKQLWKNLEEISRKFA